MKKHLQLIPLVYCIFLASPLFAQNYRDSLDLERPRHKVAAAWVKK